MIIELPGFDSEKPQLSAVPAEPLLTTIQQFLDKKGINSNEYAIGSQIPAGFGELVIRNANNFWLIYTAERGTNFDITVFSSEHHAVNYFIFRLTGENETIDWSSI